MLDGILEDTYGYISICNDTRCMGIMERNSSEDQT